MTIQTTQGAEQGKNISLQYSSDEPANNLHPAFCFKYLHKKHGFPEDKKHKTAVLNTIKTLSNMSWGDISVAGFKDGRGYEKISQLKEKAPIKMSKESEIISFYCSSSGRMIGYRDLKIFYVFWFDWSPFKVYKHS